MRQGVIVASRLISEYDEGEEGWIVGLVSLCTRVAVVDAPSMKGSHAIMKSGGPAGLV